MENSFLKLSHDFRESLTQFIWDQWVSIGVAGSNKSSTVPFIIDPEALLLATTQFCRKENRLLSEVLDWLALNGKSINLQRLKNHHFTTLVGDMPLLLGMAERLIECRQSAWKAVLKWERKDDISRPKPQDTSNITLRGMSKKTNAQRPEAFIFKMRALFGVNARVEVLTWLMTHESGFPAEIARETAWFSKSIQIVLNDLERSQMIFSSHTDKREKHFRLSRKSWQEFLSPDQSNLKWFNQISFYQGCIYISQILDKIVALQNPTDRMQSIAIREYLPFMAMGFEKAGAGHLFAGHRHQSGEDLVNLFWKDVKKVQSTLSGSRTEWQDSPTTNFSLFLD